MRVSPIILNFSANNHQIQMDSPRRSAGFLLTDKVT